MTNRQEALTEQHLELTEALFGKVFDRDSVAFDVLKAARNQTKDAETIAVLRGALEDITKHQKIIAGNEHKWTAALNIASKALTKTEGDGNAGT